MIASWMIFLPSRERVESCRAAHIPRQAVESAESVQDDMEDDVAVLSQSPPGGLQRTTLVTCCGSSLRTTTNNSGRPGTHGSCAGLLQ